MNKLAAAAQSEALDGVDDLVMNPQTGKIAYW
jgi:hypothetical protein